MQVRRRLLGPVGLVDHNRHASRFFDLCERFAQAIVIVNYLRCLLHVRSDGQLVEQQSLVSWLSKLEGYII